MPDRAGQPAGFRELLEAIDPAGLHPQRDRDRRGGAGFGVSPEGVKRTADLDDPASYVEAIKATDLQTLVGPVKFANALPNCALTPLVGGQWIGSVGNWERLGGGT